ncbi:rhomboid family intramembrane serine protease [Blautia sp.]
MKFIDKLERKFGRFGIPNLTVYIIVCYVIGYALMIVNPGMLNWLSLEPAYILRGQVWRLVTWVLYPPSTSGVLWFAIAVLFFYYPIGTSLERTIGTFKYTLYILSGIVFTIIGAFILYFLLGGNVLVGSVFSTYYISLSTFLAYALCYPDMQVLLMFIIPVKMKWMAIFYVVIVVYEMIQYIMAGAWYLVIPIVASLLNFIIFYFGTKDFSRYNPKEVHRRNEFRRAMEPQGRMKSGGGAVTKHKCAICGRTELDDPNLEFRFCSRCNGNYEYCQDHLFTHTHVK